MIESLSLRSRLTAWYFLAMALSSLLIGFLALYGMERSILDVVDGALQQRADAIKGMAERKLRTGSIDLFKRELREHSALSSGVELMQVADSQGNWLYRSELLASHAVPLPTQQLTIHTAVFNGLMLRVRTERAQFYGQPLFIQVAMPTHEFHEALTRFRYLFAIAAPFVLLCATSGGYFLSRRALQPVQRIIDATETIGATNLSSRLFVPATGDELQRLSETLNNMLARIESAFQRVAEFTADASHELRTPLAILRTRAELALRRPRSDAEYREVLQQLLVGLERSSELVERLMLLARSDSGDRILLREPVELDQLLHTVCEQAAGLPGALDLTFKTQLSSEALIEGDADFLQRLFLILLDNAVKYTPAGGVIEVTTLLKGKDVTVQVRDSGIGIDAAHLPHLFERFYRVDKARSRESGGAGLGLAIGRWIARAHGGDIQVSSTPDQGTVFEVQLPAIPMTHAP